MAIATLATWLLTVGIGACMLRAWIARGGPLTQRARADGLPPMVIYAHAILATTGLVVWISYVVTRVVALAWCGAGLLMPVAGLGVAMVTVWTPYPGPHPAGAGSPAAGGVLAPPAENELAGRLTDEVLARALSDEALARALTEEVLASLPAGPSQTARKPRRHLTPLVPAGHGAAALTTILLATITAVSAR